MNNATEINTNYFIFCTRAGWSSFNSETTRCSPFFRLSSFSISRLSGSFFSSYYLWDFGMNLHCFELILFFSCKMYHVNGTIRPISHPFRRRLQFVSALFPYSERTSVALLVSFNTHSNRIWFTFFRHDTKLCLRSKRTLNYEQKCGRLLSGEGIRTILEIRRRSFQKWRNIGKFDRKCQPKLTIRGAWTWLKVFISKSPSSEKSSDNSGNVPKFQRE